MSSLLYLPNLAKQGKLYPNAKLGNLKAVDNPEGLFFADVSFPDIMAMGHGQSTIGRYFIHTTFCSD